MNFEELSQMSVEDLRALNHLVVDVIKIKQQMLSKQIARELSIGDVVKLDHEKYKNDRFIIKKINKTKANIMSETTKIHYDAPMNMLQKIV